jgi:hypothetical protein
MVRTKGEILGTAWKVHLGSMSGRIFQWKKNRGEGPLSLVSSCRKSAKADTVNPGLVGLAKIKTVFSRREKNEFNSQFSYDLNAAVGRIAMSSLF